MSSRQLNFVRQQGWSDASRETCSYQFPALMWQPRAVSVLTMVGLVAQSPTYFVALGALLGWSAVLPGLNLFDAVFNRFFARRERVPRLGPARAPRRFAQALGGAAMLAIGLALADGAHMLAWTLELLLVAGLVALIFGRFCVGSWAYLHLTGRGRLANRTLPWARD